MFHDAPLTHIIQQPLKENLPRLKCSIEQNLTESTEKHYPPINDSTRREGNRVDLESVSG